MQVSLLRVVAAALLLIACQTALAFSFGSTTELDYELKNPFAMPVDGVYLGIDSGGPAFDMGGYIDLGANTVDPAAASIIEGPGGLLAGDWDSVGVAVIGQPVSNAADSTGAPTDIQDSETAVGDGEFGPIQVVVATTAVYTFNQNTSSGMATPMVGASILSSLGSVSIPEPSTLALFGLPLMLMALTRRKHRF